MCYFYGLRPNEIWSLDIETDWILWESITVIEAQEMLKSLTASSFPNYSKSDRQKLHKKLNRQAYPASFEDQVELTADKLAMVLRS